METVAENLGEVLRGDKIMNSNYELKMGVEETCKILCKKDLTASEAKEFSVRVEEDYRVHWVMDNLPSATKVSRGLAGCRGHTQQRSAAAAMAAAVAAAAPIAAPVAMTAAATAATAAAFVQPQQHSCGSIRAAASAPAVRASAAAECVPACACMRSMWTRPTLPNR